MANAIPDQSATAGTAFSYVFPAHTFSDADTGDTLSYTATKTDDTALPTWLAFAASTRTFSGTPQAADAGTVAVKVTASDGNGGSVSDEFDITVIISVPSNWTLKPTALAAGAKFRLLFLSSTKRNASSTDIADYNTFIQTRAAAGHADIRDYSAGFRAVGCTDATYTTYTTYTSTDKGVPIYWLNGAKAADQYEDFYDGSWDDEANDKNESGTNGPDTSQVSNYPLTGCEHDGTEGFNFFNISLGLGSSGGSAVGRPNSSATNTGPINGDTGATVGLTRPLYGLSAVFQVAAAVVTTVPGAPTGLAATADRTSRINIGWTAPASTGGSAITGYRIEISSDGGSTWTDQVANTNSTLTLYFHDGPLFAPGTTRHFRVSAINANGTGLPSNVASATTTTTVPGAPTGLTAMASGATAINLSWSAQASTGRGPSPCCREPGLSKAALLAPGAAANGNTHNSHH